MKLGSTFKVRIKTSEADEGAVITFKRERLNESFLLDNSLKAITESDAKSSALIGRILNNIVAVEGLECDGVPVTVEQLHGPIEQLPLYSEMLSLIVLAYGEARRELSEKKASYSVE
jgi:hypothetical protein